MNYEPMDLETYREMRANVLARARDFPAGKAEAFVVLPDGTGIRRSADARKLDVEVLRTCGCPATVIFSYLPRDIYGDLIDPGRYFHRLIQVTRDMDIGDVIDLLNAPNESTERDEFVGIVDRFLDTIPIKDYPKDVANLSL